VVLRSDATSLDGAWQHKEVFTGTPAKRKPIIRVKVGGCADLELAMYVVIRKFSRMRSVAEAARRAESGLGQMLKQMPGFKGYWVFDAGDEIGGSISLFESREAALAANEKALAWIRASLADVIDGEPEITMGDVLTAVTP